MFLLEPYVKREGEELLGSVNIEGDRFLIESVFNERLKQERLEFLIKWVGYLEYESMWEPLEHLDESDKVIIEFRMRRAVASMAKSKIKTPKKQTKRSKRPRDRPRKKI